MLEPALPNRFINYFNFNVNIIENKMESVEKVGPIYETFNSFEVDLNW